MVSQQRELKRVHTSSGYGFGRMGIPASHRMGKPAYSPHYQQYINRKHALYKWDPLSNLKAFSDTIYRVFVNGQPVFRRRN